MKRSADMDEITKMKSEAYDILVKIQHLQMLLEEKNKQITKAIESQIAEKPKRIRNV